jgi:cation diffusion facilitator CzcD-associated flavoprotein CzcO
MDEHVVTVIGAGPAGLAVAGELGCAGIPTVVLERAGGVAAAWRRRYDRLRLNTCRWTSKLPRTRYPAGTALFPTRDQMVGYLEGYAERNELDIRFHTQVERVERSDGTWTVATERGAYRSQHVVVATGYEHTPSIPEWPGREGFLGRLMHAAEYLNADPFRGMEVLVVGPGCSGMEIAFDLVEGGAGKVSVAVRTQPNIMPRQSGGMPGDLPALALLSLPPRLSDPIARFVRRMSIGDLTGYGLTVPAEGPFARMRRQGKAPAIVDAQVIDAIKDGRIGIVAGLEAFDGPAAVLADGTRIEPDLVVAATGYRRGLERLVGHLGVLDDDGIPRVHGGPAAAAGLWFIGYLPRPGQIGLMGREATRIAREIKQGVQPVSGHVSAPGGDQAH